MAVRLEAVTPAETVWTKVAAALRGELGEGAFNSYVAPSAVREGYSGAVCLVTPTAYARDWVRRNALRRVAELVGARRGPLPAIVAGDFKYCGKEVKRKLEQGPVDHETDYKCRCTRMGE